MRTVTAEAESDSETLPDDLRCKAVHKTAGRCTRPLVAGMDVCTAHGAATRASRNKQLMKRLTYGLARIPVDSSLRDPVAAFENDLVRTASRIEYLDGVIAKLTDDELVWGKISEDVRNATEWPGIDLGYGAHVNAFIELQFRERRHLLDLNKVFFTAKLDLRRMEIMQNQATTLEVVMVAILAKLGHDAANPSVRAVISNELMNLPGAGARNVEIREAAERLAGEDEGWYSEAMRD